MATLETQYKNFLKDNPNSNMPFEEWKKVNARLIKQALVNMMKADEELGLYDEPKQETLEEVNWKVLGSKEDTFFNGAKWQQERMYSEEEVDKLTLEALDLGMRIRQDQLSGYSKKSGKELHKEWFEQFRKK